jgi:hypothetical protein
MVFRFAGGRAGGTAGFFVMFRPYESVILEGKWLLLLFSQKN